MTQKIILPTQAEQTFAQLAKENLDSGGNIVELLGFFVGKVCPEGVTVTDLILPVQLGTASKVDDLGICGKDSSMWLFEDSSCSIMNKENFRIIAWVHTHVQGTPCGLSSIDCHTQFAYSRLFKNVYAVVLEVRDDDLHKMDWFDLTKDGSMQIEDCIKNANLSREQHHECSSPSMFSSHSSIVETRPIPLTVTDARKSRPLDMFSHETRVEQYDQPAVHMPEPPVQVKCKNCLKEYISEQNLFGHVSKAKKCKAAYSQEFESMKKKIVKARQREKYQKQKEKKRLWYQANKQKMRDKYQANKEKIREKYQANKQNIFEKYQANKEKVLLKYQEDRENIKEKYLAMPPAKKQKLIIEKKQYYDANRSNILNKRKKHYTCQADIIFQKRKNTPGNPIKTPLLTLKKQFAKVQCLVAFAATD